MITFCSDDVPLQPLFGSEAHETRGERICSCADRQNAPEIPNLTLRTSFVVGFPGETEKEFEELCEFTKEVGFDWMGAFGYSDQEGASAFDLEDKVSAREIESRRKSLMSIQKKISRAKKRTLVGRELDLLLMGPPRKLIAPRRPHFDDAPEIDGKKCS
jgi:ribosomal protein S12 methylthiotransferase